MSRPPLDEACDRIYGWHMEGLPLLGYDQHVRRGKVYMALLLDMKVVDDRGTDYTAKWLAAYAQAGHRLVEEINGPHGYAMLQTAIVRYKERLKREEKQFIRNKKARERANVWREQQKEEQHARLQDVAGAGHLLPR